MNIAFAGGYLEDQLPPPECHVSGSDAKIGAGLCSLSKPPGGSNTRGFNPSGSTKCLNSLPNGLRYNLLGLERNPAAKMRSGEICWDPGICN